MKPPIKARSRQAFICPGPDNCGDPSCTDPDCNEISEEPAVTSHVYLSTACWHEQHDGDPSMHASCRATCKWCGQGCSCSGHPDRDTEEQPPHWVDQARDVARELWNHGYVTPELEQRVAEDPHLFWLRGEEQPPGTWTPPAREGNPDA